MPKPNNVTEVAFVLRQYNAYHPSPLPQGLAYFSLTVVHDGTFGDRY
ncbi:hypothetical protein [Anabaena subtropica]|uniref:Uncharacterized protein n=1 Tax=Anabaena subtropica FACHB-260 TaxID=2692884 RepID=A0ABR8CVM7_9NOST|nr:hypothetical protein [Anabaena subtropica]MBD2346811.1 hypothetical protein [Anabaena subtropica FACHB-260]